METLKTAQPGASAELEDFDEFWLEVETLAVLTQRLDRPGGRVSTQRFSHYRENRQRTHWPTATHKWGRCRDRGGSASAGAEGLRGASGGRAMNYQHAGKRMRGWLGELELPAPRKPRPDAAAIIQRLSARDLLLRGGSRAGSTAAAAVEGAPR
jgi:hypothetical protein